MTTPIVFGSAGRAELLLQLEEALGAQLDAERLQPRHQVPFAGQPHMGRAEAEARGRRPAAGVVVGPAGDHHLGAVAQGTLGEAESLKVVQPDLARNRAVAVAELEVGLDLAPADPGDLADQEHPRPFAHLLLEHLRVAPDRERAGKVGTGTRSGRKDFWLIHEISLETAQAVSFQRLAQAFNSSIAGPRASPVAVSE